MTRALIIAALFVCATGCMRNDERAAATSSAPAQPEQQTQSSVPIPTGPPSASFDFTSLLEREGPAVVNVVTTAKGTQRAIPQTPQDLFEFFRRFGPRSGEAQPRDEGSPRGEDPRKFGRGGIGSGFIISADGYILTNAHVVEGAATVTVHLADASREFSAQVIGADRRTDVALLKINATGLPAVTLGKSTDLKVGEWVAAIGSPFGFDNTITAGIVSGKGRTIPHESFVPFIQTDVAVNPGNSGGPLLNMKGEVVGINSLIYSVSGGYMGLSFAIPIETALDVSTQLRTHGKVTRGRLGVAIQEVTRELAESFRLPTTTGVLISAVEKGSPAQKAGLAAGDVVLKYNGTTVDSVYELPRLVSASKPGSVAALDVWREGASRQINVTLGEVPRPST